ncbi:hypothetical protein D3C86_1497990 [compost metagenome]
MHAQGDLFGILRVEKGRVLFQVNLDQSLRTLVGDHVSVGTDELHRLRIAEADQRHAPDDPAVQGQFNQFGVFVGDREQALAHRIERQRGHIVVQAFDDACLERDLITIQADGLRTFRLPKRVQVEPGALEQAQVLAERNQHDQRNRQEHENQGFGTGKSAHSSGLGFKTG